MWSCSWRRSIQSRDQPIWTQWPGTADLAPCFIFRTLYRIQILLSKRFSAARSVTHRGSCRETTRRCGWEVEAGETWEAEREKPQGIPLNPCSQCWYVGDLSYLDPGLKLSYLDVYLIGISTLTAGVAGDLVWSRHQSLDSSSVFRFNPPSVYHSSPIGTFARSTFSRWYLVGSPWFRMATHESGFSTPSMKIP